MCEDSLLDDYSTEGKLFRVITSPKRPPGSLKKALFWLKKVVKSSWCVLATQICRLKSLNRGAEVILERVTTATRQKTSSPQDIGLAKHGEMLTMQVEEVLSRLEKHEAECNLRYKRIEERLDDQKELIAQNSEALSKLDLKIWGIAVLIVLAPVVANFWG